jgi:hypothetical protein
MLSLVGPACRLTNAPHHVAFRAALEMEEPRPGTAAIPQACLRIPWCEDPIRYFCCAIALGADYSRAGWYFASRIAGSPEKRIFKKSEL